MAASWSVRRGTAFLACTCLEEHARKQFEAAALGGQIVHSADEARDCMALTDNPRLF